MSCEHQFTDKDGRKYVFTLFKSPRDDRNVEQIIGANGQNSYLLFLKNFSADDNKGYFFRDFLKQYFSAWGGISSLDDNGLLNQMALLMSQGWIKAFLIRRNAIVFKSTPKVDLKGAKQARQAETAAIRERAEQIAQTSQTQAVTDWIEIELIDHEGNPVPGEAYKIVTPDQRTIWGKLDKDGKAKHENLQAGECEVTFPDLDGGFGEPYIEPEQETETELEPVVAATPEDEAAAEQEEQNEQNAETDVASETPEEEYEQFYEFSNYVKKTYDKLDSPVNKMIQSSGEAA